MKANRCLTLALGAALLVSSCGIGSENTASGGFLGAQLGSIIGSAIGGISGGPRGSDIGTLVGMAGGAVVGAVVGNEADKANRRAADEYAAVQRSGTLEDMDQESRKSQAQTDNTFDPNNGGDDVIDFDAPAPAPAAGESRHPKIDAEVTTDASLPALEIRSIRFVSKNNDMTLCSGELAKVVVEVFNNSADDMYNVQPEVKETTGNRHIDVSAPIIVEKISSGKGIRYTAMVKADKKLKDGTVNFSVLARSISQRRCSQVKEFSVTTKR